MPSYSIRVVFILIAFSLTTPLFRQGGATGAITGTVQDPSGAVIANAEIRITNQDTDVLERTVTSGADGNILGSPATGWNVYGEHTQRGICGGQFPRLS
jgi:carboxypeptidase family protein